MHKKSADVNKIPLFGQIYRLCRHKRSSTSTHPDTAWTIWSWWRRWKVFYGYWHVAKASNGMIIRLYIKCPFPTKCQHGIYFIIWDDEMSVYFEMTWFTFSCAQRLRFYHCRNLIGDRISIFGLSINLFLSLEKIGRIVLVSFSKIWLPPLSPEKFSALSIFFLPNGKVFIISKTSERPFVSNIRCCYKLHSR